MFHLRRPHPQRAEGMLFAGRTGPDCGARRFGAQGSTSRASYGTVPTGGLQISPAAGLAEMAPEIPTRRGCPGRPFKVADQKLAGRD
jgi:hypothetical protein